MQELKFYFLIGIFLGIMYILANKKRKKLRYATWEGFVQSHEIGAITDVLSRYFFIWLGIRYILIPFLLWYW